MRDNELQSRALLQPPADPLRQLPTTTQSLRPKLLHLCQDHVGNAPRQCGNHGHDDGRLESAQKGKGIALSPLPKFLSTASLLYNVPTKRFDLGQRGRQVVMSPAVRSLAVTISLVRLLLLADRKDGSPTGVVR